MNVPKFPREVHWLLSDFNETSISSADLSKNTSNLWKSVKWVQSCST